MTYAPQENDLPDPGEVVWGWVPYEDDPKQGKDRPVLVLAEEDGVYLCLMMSSKDHDLDAEDEARWGRYWMDIGSGPWDVRRRPSEVRLDRLLRMRPEAIRREGAAVPRRTFNRVVKAAAEFHRLPVGTVKRRSGPVATGRRILARLSRGPAPRG